MGHFAMQGPLVNFLAHILAHEKCTHISSPVKAFEKDREW